MPSHNTLPILKRISNAFPEKHLNQATFQVYQEELADIPPALLERVASQLIRTARWFPRIAEIRRVAEQLAGTALFSHVRESSADSLSLERQKLEQDYFHRGIFNAQVWTGLAEQLERIGRIYQSAEVRRKAIQIEFNELARQRGEDYPPQDQRLHYAVWDNYSDLDQG